MCKGSSSYRRFLGAAGASVVLLSLAGWVAAGAEDRPSPYHVAVKKIADEFRRSVQKAQERYEKQIQPITLLRAKEIDRVARNARARLDRAAQEAKQAGSDVGESLAKAEAEGIARSAAAARIAGGSAIWRVTYKGHRYLAVLAPLTWLEAKKACEQMGGHLAYVETKEEMQFLQKLTSGTGCWVGSTDKAKEGNWRWGNGARVDRKLWGHNEPDNAWGGQDYAFVNAHGLGDGGEKGSPGSGFICEWD